MPGQPMMQVKTIYDKSLFVEILKSQRHTEQLIQEILSKVCPIHGSHANIQIKEGWEINTITCCEDFDKLIDHIVNYFTKKI